MTDEHTINQSPDFVRALSLGEVITDRLDADVSFSDEEIKELLKRPPDMSIATSFEKYDELFKTWTLGPVIRHAHEGLVDMANGVALQRHLESDPTLSDDWIMVNMRHFAYGWVDHLCFRVLGGDPTPDQKSKIDAQELVVDRLTSKASEARYAHDWDNADYWECEEAKERNKLLSLQDVGPTRIARVIKAWFDELKRTGAIIADLEVYRECKSEALRDSIERDIDHGYRDSLKPEVDVSDAADAVLNYIGGADAACDKYGYPHDIDIYAILSELGVLDNE